MKNQLLKNLLSNATLRKVTSAQWNAIDSGNGKFENYHKILFHNMKVFTIITTISPDGRRCFGINFPFIGSLFIFKRNSLDGDTFYSFHHNGLFKEWEVDSSEVNETFAIRLTPILEQLSQFNGLSNKQLADNGWSVAKIKELIRGQDTSKSTETNDTPETELVEENQMKKEETLMDETTNPNENQHDEKEVKKFKQKVPFTENEYLRLVEVKDYVNGGMKKLVGFFMEGLDTIGEVSSDHTLVHAMSYMENRCINGGEFRLHQRDEGVELSLHIPKSFDYDSQMQSKYTLNLGLFDVHFVRYITPAPEDTTTLEFDEVKFVGIGDGGVFNVYSDTTLITDMGRYQDIHEKVVFPTNREVEVEVVNA